jgi:hypothetical protein
MRSQMGRGNCSFTHHFVQGLGQIGNVQVGGTIISLGLEPGVEGFLKGVRQVKSGSEDGVFMAHTSKADFIAKAMKSSDAHFGALGIDKLGKSEAKWGGRGERNCKSKRSKSRMNLESRKCSLTPCKHQFLYR